MKEKDEKNIQPNYYAVIPANVRYNKKLPAYARLLYGEITALTNFKGYCWASNKYFADLYDVAKKTISAWISKLCKYGYLKVELIYKNESKEVEKRIIKINTSKIEVTEEDKKPNSKNKPPIKDKNILSLLKMINDIGGFNHKLPNDENEPALKLLSKVSGYLQAMKNHKLSRSMDGYDDKWFDQNNIDFSITKKIKTWDDVKSLVNKAVRRYKKMREISYWPENKKWLPKNMSTFFYNPINKKSWFLYCLFNRPKELDIVLKSRSITSIRNKLPVGVIVAAEEYFEFMRWCPKDKPIFWKKIKGLYDFFSEYKDRLHDYNGGNWTGICGNFKRLLERVKEFSDTWDSWSIKNFGYNNNTWSYFVAWIMKKYGINLHPGEKKLKLNDKFVSDEK